MQTERGQSIEDASMRVIEEEAGDHGYGVREWQVVRRIIHSTADFDFAGRNRVAFSPGAIDAGLGALRGGRGIVADVNGVLGGLNKRNPADYGNRLVCRISDPGIRKTAEGQGTTRARAAMRASAGDMEGGIAVVGNAPTALQEVVRMAREGEARPALVVGLPVGFICAAESKEELAGLRGTPFITNSGRKGGSPSASAVVNALYVMLRESAP